MVYRALLHFLVQVCAKARLLDATAYLLERSGDTEGAFRLMLEVMCGVQATRTLTVIVTSGDK